MGTFTYGSLYSGTGYTGYTGSPSFVSLPTTGATTTLPSRTPRIPHSPPINPHMGLMHLSRITERTEESNPQSRPVSGVSILSGPGATCPTNPTPCSGPVIHSRGATDPSSDRTLPPPSHLSELCTVFESQPTTGSHSRTTSTPSYQRASSPLFGASSGFTATGTGTGYTGRRSVSPSKSQSSGSGGSYSTGGTSLYGSVLSPPLGPCNLASTTVEILQTITPPTGARTYAYTDSRTYDSRSGTNTNTNTYTYDSTSVVTPTRTTNDNTLRRPQTSLYPHLLLLSWLSPGGGRGIVALDLLNCTSVVNLFGGGGLGGREAREVGDVGGSAAREQDEEMRTTGSDRPRLVDTLVPFHMLYADDVERLAAESLLERQKWVNRIWEAVNRPVTVPDSVSVIRSPQSQSRSYSPTRSPTRTILSIDTFDCRITTRTSGSGSRSTVFVPPLHSLPDISDYLSNTSGRLSR
ncbi:hypothetical protein D9619_009643 [Psilocybe cf. subviscida]|uniref:Uncharacterized protein n=1 Tax=Psilocybe cf. subviscida TaxID=2480587 RepID=A0A8H5BL11_9AGAR|nr:hypothetical protein D9619_009643 [Psilocybe cf. subviscida]